VLARLGSVFSEDDRDQPCVGVTSLYMCKLNYNMVMLAQTFAHQARTATCCVWVHYHPVQLEPTMPLRCFLTAGAAANAMNKQCMQLV
jgi:hypothetical protein